MLKRDQSSRVNVDASKVQTDPLVALTALSLSSVKEHLPILRSFVFFLTYRHYGKILEGIRPGNSSALARSQARDDLPGGPLLPARFFQMIIFINSRCPCSVFVTYFISLLDPLRCCIISPFLSLDHAACVYLLS